jgi:hypothetical protein
MLRGQKKLAAQVRQAEIERKVQSRKAQSSGDTGSQWGQNLSEDKLIKGNHYAKNSGQARVDYLRGEVRRKKAEQKAGSLTLIKR